MPQRDQENLARVAPAGTQQVRAKHSERMRRKRSDYGEMVAALSETRTNERLQMVVDLDE
jgi:hypothetical protein